ncbi:Type II secretion system (T2SS), protein F [Streptomyces sp. WMMB 714]|uniref:type II secretion system F family protein n=1 Tax=Streptomyces sp. WMMB 714 TaxID=1286822 RepID=UPI000823C662|nr:type II secretion system F family protein [Streptomyces sp. WMMB 714]SCK45763.1 Type II secretion system (T2SS), protein F [Streptomyces sp. WMMB 714]
MNTAMTAADPRVWVPLLVACGALAGLCWELWKGRRARTRGRLLLGQAAGREQPERPEQRGSAGLRRSGRAARPPQHCLDAHRQWWRRRVRRGRLRAGAAATGAGALIVTVVEGVPGWLAAGIGAYCVWRWAVRREGSDVGSGDLAELRTAGAQLPLAAELLAACLAAGSAPDRAADAVGRSVGGPLGARLTKAATELHLGAEPAAVWGRFGSLPGGATFVRSMERAGSGGVPAAESVTRLAAELRATASRAAAARARRAAVLVTGPLGLCFLPAFLAVGVAPVVIGLARSLL